jgi:hypothetical protein
MLMKSEGLLEIIYKHNVDYRLTPCAS